MKKVIFYFIALMAFYLLNGCGDKLEESREQIDRHRKSSITYMAQGQFRAAVLEAQNIVRIDPTSPDGYLLLGEIYNQIGAYATTQQVLSKVVEQMPEVSTELAHAYLHTKKYRTAIDVIDKYPAAADYKDNVIRQKKILALSSIYLGEVSRSEKLLEDFKNSGGSLIDQAYIQASSHMAQGDLDSAQTLLENALKENPQNIDVLQLLATIDLYQQRLDKAEQKLTHILGLLKATDVMTVDRSKTLAQLIDVLVQLGRTSEAYTYQKILVEANPETNAAQQRFNEALELYQQGNFSQAEIILDQLREQFPDDPNTGTLLGMIEFQKGEDYDAAHLFDEFVDPETATSTVIQAAALAKYRTNKIDEAVDLLKKASESQPKNPTVLTTYGLALLDQNKTSDEGARALEKSLAINPQQHRVRLALAKRYFILQKNEQALGQLQKAYQGDPLDLMIQQTYFKALFNDGQSSVVRNEITEFQKKYPNNSRGDLMEAWLYMEEKKYPEAEKSFKKAIRNSENNEIYLAYTGLAQLHEVQKQPEKAYVMWQEALRSSPASLSIYGHWLRNASLLKRLDDASSFLRELEKNSLHWQPSTVLAQLMARKGDLESAIQHIELALDRSNSSEQVKRVAVGFYQLQGNQYRAQQDYQKAKASFMKASRLYPDSYDLLANLIQIEVADNKIHEAQRLLDQFVSNKENDAARLFLQGYIRFHEHKKEDAIALYYQSWNKNPMEQVAESIYRYHLSSEENDKAHQFIDEWIKKLPHSHKPVLLKALKYQQENNSEQAIVWYEKTISIAANLPVAMNNLAWLYYEKKDERAVSTAKKAYELAPRSPEILDTYGWILVESNRVAEGFEILSQAVKLAPDNKDIKNHYEIAKSRLH